MVCEQRFANLFYFNSFSHAAWEGLTRESVFFVCFCNGRLHQKSRMLFRDRFQVVHCEKLQQMQNCLRLIVCSTPG